MRDIEEIRLYNNLEMYARFNRAKELEEALKNVSDEMLNSVDPSGNTILHHAVRLGSDGIDTVKILLNRENIKVNIPNNGKYTPLHFAANSGASKESIEILKLLLAREDINIDAQNWRKNTPLHLAAAGNFREGVKLLLERSQDPKKSLMITNNIGETPLHNALEHLAKGSRTVVKTMIKYLKSKEIATIFNMPVIRGYHVDTETMMDIFRGYTMLQIAAVKNKLNIIPLLITYGGDVETINENIEKAVKLYKSFHKNTNIDEFEKVVNIGLEKWQERNMKRQNKSLSSSIDRFIVNLQVYNYVWHV